MNVLVTGGAGYIGSHTCVSLLESGYQITVIDNFDNSSPIALERVSQITGKSFKSYKNDVCDTQAVIDIIKQNSIDCIIHFAGLKAVGESVAKPLMYYRNNLVSTISLLEAMEQTGVKNLIFSSSATVYSQENIAPFTETDRLGCTNPYGWTKFMNEQIIKDAANAHKDWSCVLLRYFNPIGAHKSGLIGEDPEGIPNNLMPYIAQTAIGRRKSLTVFGNDYDTVDGTGVRDYIHVCDLAYGHVLAIKYAQGRTGCDAINLGTGKGVSVLQMIAAFEKASGVKVPYTIGPRRPGDIDTVFSDPAKAERLLNWKAERDLDDMCRDTWNWQKKNPMGYK